MTEPASTNFVGRKRLGELLADIPRLLGDLLRAEIDSLREEFARSARRAGLGIGLIVAAVAVLLIAVVALVVGAIAALALVLPFWAAALIVAGGLIVVAALLAGLGALRLRGAGPNLDRHLDSFTDDLRAIRGEVPRAPTEED